MILVFRVAGPFSGATVSTRGFSTLGGLTAVNMLNIQIYILEIYGLNVNVKSHYEGQF